MTLERADRLKTPPVVGERYLVPVLQWRWAGTGRRLSWWPVIGHKHTDIEHFNFPWPHYHVDPRFMTRRLYANIDDLWSYESKFKALLKQPISEFDGIRLPKPSLRPMRCTMATVPYPFADRAPIVAINNQFAGRQCPKGKRGFVCPHRHIALGSIEPIDGVITCPMHGLRIDAATGICLGPLVGDRAAHPPGLLSPEPKDQEASA